VQLTDKGKNPKTGKTMDEIFAKKVKAAAVAGWWTVLIAYCILLIQWIAYLVIMKTQPAAILYIWGGGITWLAIRDIWLLAMVAYKLCVAMMIFIVIWLTLWAKQLSKK
jgi:hypothetical protein